MSVDNQRRLDEIERQLNDLYEQVRAKDAERDKFDRLVHPEDYVPVSQSDALPKE